jgi:hypothetical protein
MGDTGWAYAQLEGVTVRQGRTVLIIGGRAFRVDYEAWDAEDSDGNLFPLLERHRYFADDIELSEDEFAAEVGAMGRSEGNDVSSDSF